MCTLWNTQSYLVSRPHPRDANTARPASAYRAANVVVEVKSVVLAALTKSWRLIFEDLLLDWPLMSLTVSIGVCVALALGLENIHVGGCFVAHEYNSKEDSTAASTKSRQ